MLPDDISYRSLLVADTPNLQALITRVYGNGYFNG